MKIAGLLLIGLVATILFYCEDEDLEYSREDTAYQLAIDLSGSLQNPAFSPDGNAIVFTRFRDGYNLGPADLYLYNLSTKTLSSLVADGSGNVNLPGSIWNSVTQKITFSSTRGEHDEIFIISADGSNGDETRITHRTDHVAYEPSFSPDGEWVVFESHVLDVETNGVITKYMLDGSSEYLPLTGLNDDCRQPNWSPTGDKILYQKYQDGNWDIWVIDNDGSNPARVTDGDGDNTDASFTPDGQFIVYSTDFELESANVYRIPVTGGTPERLSNSEGYDGAPSISPDNTKLAFESYPGDPDDSSGSTLWLLDGI